MLHDFSIVARPAAEGMWFPHLHDVDLSPTIYIFYINECLNRRRHRSIARVVLSNPKLLLLQQLQKTTTTLQTLLI